MKIYPKMSFNQSFTGDLVLNKPEKWNSGIAHDVLNNDKLQRLAAESDSDLILYQSVRRASQASIHHSPGEPLYRISIAKQQKSTFLNIVKRALGIDKIPFSRNHHSSTTTCIDILPGLSYRELKTRLFNPKIKP